MLTLQFFGIDSQTHQEHEDHNADLAQRIQEAQAGRWKQVGRSARRQPSQQRRPQQNAGEHFTHDARLPKLAEEAAHQAANAKNHRNLQNQYEEIRHQRNSFPDGGGWRMPWNVTEGQEGQ